MKRIMIVGGPGSGKSTLARQLGARTGLPVHHMDKLHWQENWIARPAEEKIALVRAVEAQDCWILEGGISTTYANRVARADLVVWLDLPVGLRLWRVTKRLFRYLGKARPDLPKGCVERLHPETVVFYGFIWTSRHRSRAKIAEALAADQSGTPVAHLTSVKEVRAFHDTFGG